MEEHFECESLDIILKLMSVSQFMNNSNIYQVPHYKILPCIYFRCSGVNLLIASISRGSVVVKALGYKPESRGFETPLLKPGL
jgi:hypothetical protein